MYADVLTSVSSGSTHTRCGQYTVSLVEATREVQPVFESSSNYKDGGQNPKLLLFGVARLTDQSSREEVGSFTQRLPVLVLQGQMADMASIFLCASQTLSKHWKWEHSESMLLWSENNMRPIFFTCYRGNSASEFQAGACRQEAMTPIIARHQI